MTSPIAHLATLIPGQVLDSDRILTDQGLVYASFRGVVRLQRHGRVVVDLGAWDDPEGVAAAYRREVAAA